MFDSLEPQWQNALTEAVKEPSFANLEAFLVQSYRERTIFPPQEHIFRAFHVTPFDRVKVVILGQDPYHGPNQANGLSFSVNEGTKLPPSLRNIYKELAQDLSAPAPTTGDLTHWAEQGVLLLNATLTVEAHAPGSHQKRGWEPFTDAAIKALSDGREGIVFILWGRYAQKKGAVIDRTKHLVIESPHPSPFSAHSGFFGSRPFSKTNAYLIQNGKTPIQWTNKKNA